MKIDLNIDETLAPIFLIDSKSRPTLSNLDDDAAAPRKIWNRRMAPSTAPATHPTSPTTEADR